MAPSKVHPYRFERRYSARTIRMLFAKSGNRCAYPGCDAKLVADETGLDGPEVEGVIAHIYSVSSEGPRPCPLEGVTQEVINGYDNLLLLCRNHHQRIDGQETSYPAELLQEWKRPRATRSLPMSYLPNEFEKFSWLGPSFTMCVLDGSIAHVGAPVMRVERKQGLLSGTREVHQVDRQLWISLDNGREFDLTLRNLDPPARDGARVSLLILFNGDGDALPYSIWNHATRTWARLNSLRSGLNWSLTRREWMVAAATTVIVSGVGTWFPRVMRLPMSDDSALPIVGFLLICGGAAVLRHWLLWGRAAQAERAVTIV